MKNKHYNRASAINPAMAEEVKQAIKKTAGMLPTASLTLEERKHLVRINVSNKVYAEDALAAASNHAELMPPWISIEEMKRSIDGFSAIDDVIQVVEEWLRNLRDTQIILGARAFSDALAVYNALEQAKERGFSGAETAFSLLAARFKASRPDANSQKD